MRADEDNDSDAFPRRGEDCPYYRPMSVLESRRSRSDESRHRNTDKRLTVTRSRTANTNNPCVRFVINQRNVFIREEYPVPVSSRLSS